MTEKPQKQSNVYFVTIDDNALRTSNPPIKIGVAAIVHKRVAELQTGNPYKIKLIASIPCETEQAAYALESMLHNLCANKFGKRLNGEWFTIYHHYSIPIIIERALKRLSTNQPKIGVIVRNKEKSKDDIILQKVREIERLKKIIQCKDYEIESINDTISKFYQTW